MVSLGCPKNLVDSEVMLGLLQGAGYRVCEAPEEAELLLVNTCGFIRSAVDEAIEEILTLAEYKKNDPTKILVVAGCLVQRYGAELRRELPEVDLFVGTEGVRDIVAALEGRHVGADRQLHLPTAAFLMDSNLPRTLTTPAHRAYLKITEGCDNRCSYCLIPSIRGRLRSRTPEDLLTEAVRLRAAGVQELTLIAQDLGAYGRDLDGRPTLVDLLPRLLEGCDIPWLRLLYLHPSRVDRDLLNLMAANPRLLPYLDIPMQHVSSRILRLMNRPYGSESLTRMVREIRAVLPDAALRTTLMVGFPGETEDDMRELLAFLEANRFDHVGVFAYEDEEGSVSAGLPDHCDEAVKEERRQRVMEVQNRISAERQQRFVGRIETVLVEGLSRETDLLLEGRTRYQAPEIDGCVYITSGTTRPGALIDVRITEAHAYDLVGEMVESGQGDL